MTNTAHSFAHGSFPETRLRRTRMQGWCRDMVAEHRLHPSDLVLPLFIQEGKDKESLVPSMPGISRISLDLLVTKVKTAHSLGIRAIALFPLVADDLKSPDGDEALFKDNLVCRAIRDIKNAVPDMGIIADVALDPYTTHGQDGVVADGEIMNDMTLDILCKQAIVQAEAGCDIIAPSDMMDGRIGAIRNALEEQNLHNTLILSYSAKYASSLYGPFRDAVDSAKHLDGADKRTYQMDSANAVEAMHEIALDVSEGADMVMIKPGLPYLDIIYRATQQFPVPVLAYQVSAEYAMIKAAAANGWLDEQAVMLESLLAFKRAGARAIFTYASLDIAQALNE